MELANGHSDMTEKDVDDLVNHPKHYTSGAIECIDYINACKFDYLEGNIVKYVTRYKHKNGVEDLRKAEFYLRMLIERELDNGIGDET
jgi:predicted dinucleotide-utilizing enzyme